jgi:DnaJ family protein C protein 28
MKIPFRKIPDSPERKGFVEEQINEAMARGDFQNLKGKGEPLQLRGDLSKADEMRQKLRRDASYGLPWEEVRREIETMTGRAENELRRAVHFRAAGLASPKSDKAKIEADFREHLKRVEEAIGAVNSLVLKHNLLLPSQLPRLYRARLQMRSLVEQVAPELIAVLGDSW